LKTLQNVAGAYGLVVPCDEVVGYGVQLIDVGFPGGETQQYFRCTYGFCWHDVVYHSQVDFGKKELV
jgi:hypothetical protein